MLRALAAILLALLGATLAHAEEARIAILHTADLHGALTAYDYLADRPAARGLVKLASLVEAVRRDSIPSLLLDAGDFMQGSPLETVYRRSGRSAEEPITAAMSRMRYDAAAVGNHEFSFGWDALGKARAGSGFPWLAANVVGADGRPAFQPSLIRSVGPIRVGVVGITTPAVPVLEDSSHWAGLSFLDPVEAATREARRLRQLDRCDVVVILAHTGIESENRRAEDRLELDEDENWGRRLAASVADADVVILGHTHEIISSRDVEGRLVTQAGKWGEGLGRVDLVLSRAAASEPWRVTSRRARVIAVSDTTASDPALESMAEPLHHATRLALAEKIGVAKTAIAAPAMRHADSPLWDLVHRVQLEASGADVSLASLDAPGARLGPGDVTFRDALRLFPYENTLAVVELSGAELKNSLEHGARHFATYGFEAGRPLEVPDVPHYLFDSAEGVTYAVDLTRPPGDRIVELGFAGQPLAPERRLKVVVSSYRLSGAGGYRAIRRAPRLWRSQEDLRDLLVAHARRVETLASHTSDNWTLLPDYVAGPERPQIDLLVRRRMLDPGEVRRLDPRRGATRAEFASWLARAFGWSAAHPSDAWEDVPDSLSAGFDALLARRVLGFEGKQRMVPGNPMRLSVAQDWCERAARRARYALAPRRDDGFREGLLAGILPAGRARPDTLSRAQALAVVANTRYPTLRVLETTDFHGAILARARDRSTGRMVGGSATLAAWVSRLRAENPHGTVLLDGGDCFQGTMISNLQFGRPVVEQMNALEYTAMAIGNHEFDWSADTLERRVRGMRFAALGANMRERKTRKPPRWVRSDTLLTRRGVRIGVLGMSYRHTPSVTLAKYVAHLRFEDDSVTAARHVPALRAVADVVVSVGHTPAESDSARRAVGGDLVRLARGIKGVDLWLGGHSHNQVIDRIGGVPLMIAGSHGQVIAVCDLVVDPVAHRVIESRTSLQPTFVDEVTPDSAMLARIENWNAEVGPIASRPVGRNARTLMRNRGGESALGNLVTDAIRASVGADIAFQNSGGLRADLPEGALTKGSIYEVMPFENSVFTMDLTGAEVTLALEQALRFGRVTQVSGIHYVFDSSRPQGQRIVSVTNEGGVPLDREKLYKVACNDFMATGGDNYEVLSIGRNRVNTGITVREVLEDFVTERSKGGGAVDYRLGGRIRRANERRDEG